MTKKQAVKLTACICGWRGDTPLAICPRCRREHGADRPVPVGPCSGCLPCSEETRDIDAAAIVEIARRGAKG